MQAHSERLAWPRRTAPASRSLETTRASSGTTVPMRTSECSSVKVLVKRSVGRDKPLDPAVVCILSCVPMFYTRGCQCLQSIMVISSDTYILDDKGDAVEGTPDDPPPPLLVALRCDSESIGVHLYDCPAIHVSIRSPRRVLGQSLTSGSSSPVLSSQCSNSSSPQPRTSHPPCAAAARRYSNPVCRRRDMSAW